MWGAIARFMDKHPALGGALQILITMGIVLYIVLALLTGVIRQSQRDACDRGNTKSLGDLRAATAEVAFANGQITYYTAKHDDAQVYLWGLKVDAQGDKITSLKQAAAKSGHPSAQDAVTVACDRIYPNPLPLPGQ